MSLFEAAKHYHDLGIAVIPFILTWNPEEKQYEKDNIGGWKKWQTEPQTDTEFNNLEWQKNGKDANAFGVLLGTKANNGMYLSVIDHDTKGEVITEEITQKAREMLKEFPITQIHRTANNGLHYVYWSRRKTETDGTFHDAAALELLGEKRLCLMPPSLGYTSLNDNTPTEIENLETTFFAVLKKYGFCKTEEIEVEKQLDSSSFNIGQIVDLTKFTKNGNEYQGSHPIHDSTTEKNFCVNPKTNTWHCFRHNSGGGALQYLAVKEGIIKCEQAKKGALRGQKFKKVLKIAATQGLIDEKVLFQSEINPIILAKDIQEDYIFVTDEDSNKLYYYDEKQGIYCDKTKQLLKREIAKQLNENFKNRYFIEINEFITATAPLVHMDKQEPELLPVSNGILNVLTLELPPFSPNHYVTTKMDNVYDPTIKYENSYNATFLKQVVSDETQRTQIQELLGHALYKKIITETSLVCKGPGGNGKSIFLTTLKSFLGKKNVSSLTMQQLCYDKFSIIEIKDKLANICIDLPHKQLMSTGTYNGLVSGDSVPISIKHVQGEGGTLDPYTKYFYSANNLPPISNEEDCYAWYRRFVFADFKKTFTPENSIPRQELLDKLSTPDEKSALLNWALDGLKRLLENGDISSKPDVETIRKEYRKRSLTTLAYFDEKVTITDNSEDIAFTDEWFRDYVTYCHENKIKNTTKGKFISDAEQHLSGIQKTRIRKKDEQGTAFGSPLSAWRYVQFVPSVPTFETILAPIKNLHTKYTGSNIPSNHDTASTDGTESAIVIQCFDCKKTLQQNEICSFGGKPFCRECRLKIEDQKKGEAQ